MQQRPTPITSNLLCSYVDGTVIIIRTEAVYQGTDTQTRLVYTKACYFNIT